eukprot:scaffold1_cov74-Skeletonema_dohrnii-CCMP3373.AAC.2
MGYYVSAEALAAAKSVEGRQQGDDITRRCSPASATEEELLNAPMSVFGGSKDNNYDIINHSNDQPSVGSYIP